MHARRGLSLLEMMLVLALMAGMAVLAMAAYSSLVKSSAIATGADLISDALAEARSDAVTQNTTIEVRLYKLASSSGDAAYSALQLHWLKPDGTTPPASPVFILPASAVIDASTEHSTLIGANQQSATDAADGRLNSATRVFHYLPDGSTDLNPATNWFLTVRSASQNDPAHFPTNWACVQVDPMTGRTRIFRP